MTPFCPFCLLENVLPAIGDYKNASAGYKARCPAHEERRPSLSIDKAKDNTVLLKCHAAVPPGGGQGLPSGICFRV